MGREVHVGFARSSCKCEGNVNVNASSCECEGNVNVNASSCGCEGNVNVNASRLQVAAMSGACVTLTYIDSAQI